MKKNKKSKIRQFCERTLRNRNKGMELDEAMKKAEVPKYCHSLVEFLIEQEFISE